jgi:hypothetical protein
MTMKTYRLLTLTAAALITAVMIYGLSARSIVGPVELHASAAPDTTLDASAASRGG